ncbi:arylamine N-acetyltransferase family protein [Sediminitomix flava]|uniref:N-hydroxyarylamine O-acetyltransferase n=1 Tax=Sediminitomix flava TaxID=379075 RepID=A0A315ZD23_SEDFL|nr:arylamine N-acetyltransferase [Sediminitomix flava]PWJ43003.1 N-hydroxyarylamine O-acetyltransferase [Sediminitomix flava]
MTDFYFDQQQYRLRIGYFDEITPTLPSLSAIHRAQHLSIPFENFDICLGKGINLSSDHLFNKLIKQKRGGYCFELNGILLLALQSFDFSARALLGRVHLSGKPTGRGHQITLVSFGEEKYIVDAGFGSNTPPMPIPLVCNSEFSFQDQSFKLVNTALFGYMLQTKYENGWKDLYSFELNHVCEGDIAYGNHYTSTSPDSLFTKSRVAVIRKENGIITLLNRRIRKALNGKEEIIFLEENQSYISALKEHFGIELNTQYEQLKPYHPE